MPESARAIPPDRLAVAQRLEGFLKSNYGEARGWKTHAANDLSMELQELRQYLPPRPKAAPGNLLQQRLRNVLLCDIDWLMGRNRVISVHCERLVGARTSLINVEAKIQFDRLGRQTSVETSGDYSIPFFVGNYFGLYIDADLLIDAPIDGHSVGISPGDIAIFEKNRTPQSGDIVAVRVQRPLGFERVIGIFRPIDGFSFSLVSANRHRRFEPVTVKKSDLEQESNGVFVAKLTITSDEFKRYGLSSK